MTVEINKLAPPAPVEPVEFELTLKLTRTEARDLFTRARYMPYSQTPSTVFYDLYHALGEYFNEYDQIFPAEVQNWYFRGNL